MRFTPLPAQSRLIEVLSYNELDGSFTWKARKDGSRRKAGTKAGSLDTKKRYIEIGLDYKLYKAHRLAWLYVTGNDPGILTVDHIDCNSLNNRFCNLRLATWRQQKLNWGGRQDVGIEYDKRSPNKPWKARFDGKRFGNYATKEEARIAYLRAYNEAAGIFAHTAR